MCFSPRLDSPSWDPGALSAAQAASVERCVAQEALSLLEATRLGFGSRQATRGVFHLLKNTLGFSIQTWGFWHTLPFFRVWVQGVDWPKHSDRLYPLLQILMAALY